ncbi:unnamed protein product [Schistosoma curassoni]|uniref:Uncharacterized protein n=1 Tax=Schistosoma curassoni TaxID=6186 RepID=A0A183L7R5_9TREM|nr:unnamed protein product [Schistosoma curassoni]
MAIRQINGANAAEPENIPAEALKSDIKVIATMFYVLLRKVLNEEQVPSDCKEG